MCESDMNVLHQQMKNYRLAQQQSAVTSLLVWTGLLNSTKGKGADSVTSLRGKQGSKIERTAFGRPIAPFYSS